REMLAKDDFDQMAAILRSTDDRSLILDKASEIRKKLNPHPAEQQTLNVPYENDEPIDGVQHKYHETVLFFPSQGQVCHSFCTFCFRWAQFIGDKNLRFSCKEADRLREYLAKHKSVSDLLITGGDPMVMKTNHLAVYLESLIQPELNHIQT